VAVPAGREVHGHPAVELRHVTKWFGKVQAVRGVTLQIQGNEFFSLLGPSGCGKTTILRMVGGFERPTEGEVFLQGHRVNDIPPYRRDTNLIFQHLALFPHLDVFDNIAFGLRMRRLDRETIRQKVSRALELVDLAGLDSRRIHQLSGGQRQRVAIARALVNEPAVLLLDEPLGSLDLRLRMQMQIELKEIQHRVGTTFIYVTHDQAEALTMSDRIAVMRDGQVEQVGTGRDVYERPRTRFVATFLGDSNLFEGRITAMDGDRVQVQTADLTVVAPAQPGVAPGATVSLCVRPERMRALHGVGAAAGAEQYENTSAVRVCSVTFKGSVIEYRLATASGHPLMMQAHSDGSPIFSQDEALTVGWRKDDCVVLMG
jgi:spermidine/putrescine transport system ATP-binding protein